MEKEDEILEEKEIKLEETQEEKKEEENTSVEEAKQDEPNEETKEENVEDKEESKNVEEIETKKENPKAWIILPIILVVLLFLSTIFAILNINNTNVVNGVFIEEVEVSNLSKEQITKIINDRTKAIENVEIYYGEYNETVKLEDLGIKLNATESVNTALGIGKSNNILIDNFNILKAMLFKTKLRLDITINEEKFKEMTQNIQAEIPEKIEQYSYEIEGDQLIITPGKEGRAVIENELEKRVIENIKNKFNGIKEMIEVPVELKKPEDISIEKIYSEIYKEAKDAYIVEEPFELYKEENGVDLKITIDEAKQILLEEKDTYTIPLKITEPKVKVKDLGDKLFKQTLSKYTTIYDAGNGNRSHNVALAAKTINGTILLPGETFSYNGVLGNTNAAKGYKQATAYVGGKVVPSYGGGICQVSSTLYNAVLYANLGIVERYNHSYAVSYVPAGRDATVAYGGKDFKFKNTRKYPIKIVASAKNGIVSISISGIKEEVEYDVVLTSSVLSTTPCKITYENNSALEEGKQKVIQSGYTGKTSIAYKILKLNGKTISKTVLSKDTYKPMDRIIEVGTKKVTVPTIAPETIPNTTPSTTVPIPSGATNTIPTNN